MILNLLEMNLFEKGSQNQYLTKNLLKMFPNKPLEKVSKNK